MQGPTRRYTTHSALHPSLDEEWTPEKVSQPALVKEGREKEDLLDSIRSNEIGAQEIVHSAFGPRQLCYADHTASGRSLSFIEQYIREEVLPMYGNTHSGATGALLKLVAVLKRFAQTSPEDGADQPAPLVLVCPMAHHSNILPWRESGFAVERAPATDSGLIDISLLDAALRRCRADAPKRVIICAFSAASNVTGFHADVVHTTSVIHQHGGIAVWDFAAAVPHATVDMNPGIVLGNDGRYHRLGKSAHIDAAVFSPHKCVGGPGTPGTILHTVPGYVQPAMDSLTAVQLRRRSRLLRSRGAEQYSLYAHSLKLVRKSIATEINVIQVRMEHHTFVNDIAEREEGGTPDIIGSIRCGLTMQLREAVSPSFIEARENEFVRRALEQWKACDEIFVLGGVTQPRHSVVSFVVTFRGAMIHHNLVVALLNDLFGIQTRGGCACAGPYAQDLLQMNQELAAEMEEMLMEHEDCDAVRPGFVRINFPYYWTFERVQFVINAVQFVSKNAWKFMPLYQLHLSTSEWRHKNYHHKNHRRWLDDVSYAKGFMTYVSRRTDSDTVESFKSNAERFESYLGAAERVLGEWLTEFFEEDCSNATVASPLPLNAEKYRWFLLPFEARSLMKSLGRSGVDGLESTPTLVLPFFTRVFSDELTRGIGLLQEARPPASADGGSEEHSEFGGGPSAAPPAAIVEVPKLPKKLQKSITRAIQKYKMIQEGDRVMVGLSGGKDSLTLLIALIHMQKYLPQKFDLAACTVDPQTEGYDPSPLIPFMEAVGVPYFYESQGLISQAKELDPSSICSFCSRMKRGIIYNCMRFACGDAEAEAWTDDEHRREGYNVLAFGQHLDDFAESLMMSLFFNGRLRTMKANYTIDKGDLRLIRPLVLVREQQNRDFAYSVGLPVINENCPGCFDAPQQRYRIKRMLGAQEQLHPRLFSSLLGAMSALIEDDNARGVALHQARQREREAATGAATSPDSVDGGNEGTAPCGSVDASRECSEDGCAPSDVCAPSEGCE